MTDEGKLAKYFRNMFGLLSLSGLWFLYQHLELINIWFKFYLVYTIISLLCFFFFLIVKPKLKIKLPFTIPKNVFTLISALLIGGMVVVFYTIPHNLYGLGASRLIWLSILGGGMGLVWALTENDGEPSLVMLKAIVFGGFLYHLGSYVTTVQSSPFSLGWSEGSQPYFASLFFSEKIYGQKLPLPILDPSRYIVNSLPFLFGIRSIFILRLWQALLWIGGTLFGAWLIVKKVGQKATKVETFWLVLFIYLFFFQGPIYYSLIIGFAFVLFGYDKEKPLKTLLFVILASIWAGLSRVNWIPLPALLAVMLYLFDEPLNEKNWFEYLKKPALWTIVGLVFAFATKFLYRNLSGENPDLFDSAFSSPLLWNRMFPNATFPLGILLGVLISCLPLLVLLIWLKTKKQLPQVHWLRWLILTGILAAFLVGGIVVSAKIGGGSNLHNLDGFYVLFIVLIVAILFGRMKPEEGVDQSAAIELRRLPFWMLALLVAVPLSFAFNHANSWTFEDTTVAKQEVLEIQAALDRIQDEPGEVLFITERQLLTTGEIEGVRIVPDYEKVIIMEMAMANNQDYLNRFYQQLSNHSFKAILLDTVNTQMQDESRGFSEENNAYAKRVVLPILSRYEVSESWHNDSIHLMLPISDELNHEEIQSAP